MIGIVDYGMGNLGSVANALTHLGLDAELLDDPASLGRHDRLILPGVGSFSAAMQNLNASGWTGVLRKRVAEGVPLLGICLGMQLLFESGDEHGPTAGIGLVPGRVVPLSPAAPLRVPHVGWNGLTYPRSHPLFRGVKQHVDFYFVHSYECEPAHPDWVLAYSDYGGELVAAVGAGNVLGVQFHPEKSQDMGLKILENFSAWDGGC